MYMLLVHACVRRVQAVLAGQDGAPTRFPLGEPAQYAEYGITHTLDQLYDAPAIVKQALADMHATTTTYVGTA